MQETNTYFLARLQIYEVSLGADIMYSMAIEINETKVVHL
jgi:hypothetical protein